MIPTLLETTKTAFKIGLLSFGGPAGQIALMHKIYVEEKKWLDEKQFLNALNFCMLLPGPEAQQLSTYIGWLHHGVRGGLITGLLFILPGALLIFALAATYALFGQTPLLQSLFFGLKAAILAVVIEALMRVSKKALKDITAYLIAAMAFLGLYFLKIPFPFIILGAGIIGYIFLSRQEVLQTSPVNFKNITRTLVIGLLLLALPFLFFRAGIYSDVTIFFTKMAFVTFGGAYAVLTYVAQQAVEQYKWLTPAEMLDGLALAETTPGPLILVLVFVGFLAGFRVENSLITAFVAGGITLFVTFLPSFLFIFTGAPFIEKIGQNARLSGALKGITAAIVGVILNLAVWTAMQTLFKQMQRGAIDYPVLSSIDLGAVGIFLITCVLLFKFHVNLIKILALAGVLGYLLGHV